MDSTAVKAIGDLAVQAEKRQQFEAPSDIPVAIVIDQGKEFKSLEAHLQNRSRYRGKLVTASIPDYISYALRRAAEIKGGPSQVAADQRLPEGTPKAVAVFIDAETMQGVTFFNLGNLLNPGHGDDKAVLTAKKTAPFAAALAASGTRFDQADASAWLEDWRDYITPLAGDRSVITLAAAVAAIRRVTIKERTESNHEQRTAGASKSVFADIEAQGAGGLPEFLSFTCVPYLGLPSVTFDLRVNVITSHDKPVFVFRVAARELLDERIAEYFKALLDEKLSGIADLTIGTFTP